MWNEKQMSRKQIFSQVIKKLCLLMAMLILLFLGKKDDHESQTE